MSDAKQVEPVGTDPYNTCAVQHEQNGQMVIRSFHTRGGMQRYLDRHGLTLKEDDGDE